jgi:hypothetical protein
MVHDRPVVLWADTAMRFWECLRGEFGPCSNPRVQESARQLGQSFRLLWSSFPNRDA